MLGIRLRCRIQYEATSTVPEEGPSDQYCELCPLFPSGMATVLCLRFPSGVTTVPFGLGSYSSAMPLGNAYRHGRPRRSLRIWARWGASVWTMHGPGAA